MKVKRSGLSRGYLQLADQLADDGVGNVHEPCRLDRTSVEEMHIRR